MPTAKRIQSITIKTVMDGSPDTSYIGTYSDRRKSPFDIDRRHAVDCPHNTGAAEATVDQLERAITYLDQQRTALSSDESPDANMLYGAVDEAIDILIEAQDAINDEGNCDCGGGNRTRRHSYAYFNGNVENYKGMEDDEIRLYIRQDYERMESLNDGSWWYVGVKAEAEIVVAGTAQTVSSPGIWGIESDSDESYFKEVEDDELSELRDILHGLGFSKRAIASAVKNVTRKH